jgi:hypothetical protein
MKQTAPASGGPTVQTIILVVQLLSIAFEVFSALSYTDDDTE